MARLEELLKAKGWKEEDLKAHETLLSDQKFRVALEESLGELESRATKAETESSNWATWYKEEALPKIDGALDREQKAAAEAAAANARLKTLQEQGLLKVAETQEQKPPEAKPQEGAYDPKKHPTWDDVGKLADAEGQAIAMASDLTAEYQELFGKSIFTYQSPSGAKGLKALREEAKAARKNLDSYVAEKFNFAGKRGELEAEAKAKAEAAIRADERAKTISEIANPNARPPQASTNTLLPKPKSGEGKQPWERDPGENQRERTSRAFTALVH